MNGLTHSFYTLCENGKAFQLSCLFVPASFPGFYCSEEKSLVNQPFWNTSLLSTHDFWVFKRLGRADVSPPCVCVPPVRRAKDQPSGVPLSAVSSKLPVPSPPNSGGVGGGRARSPFEMPRPMPTIPPPSVQVFLIIHYQPLVHSLADVILNGDLSVFTPQTDAHSAHKNTVSLRLHNAVSCGGTHSRKKRPERRGGGEDGGAWWGWV